MLKFSDLKVGMKLTRVISSKSSTHTVIEVTADWFRLENTRGVRSPKFSSGYITNWILAEEPGFIINPHMPAYKPEFDIFQPATYNEQYKPVECKHKNIREERYFSAMIFKTCKDCNKALN